MTTNKNIEVNMSGKEYLNYVDNQKIVFSKGTKKAFPYFLFSAIMVFVLIMLIGYSYNSNNVDDLTQDYLTKAKSESWNGLLKYSFYRYSPIIILLVCVAWLIHGVGFTIIKR